MNPTEGLSNKHRDLIQALFTHKADTRKLGYAIINRVHLPDYTQAVGALIQKVEESASETTIQNFLKYPVLVLQYLASYVPRAILSVIYYAIKAGTYISGGMLRQIAKWYIWKSDVLGCKLDQALEQDSIVEQLMLEQLEDLLNRRGQRAALGHSLDTAEDVGSEMVISEALQKRLGIPVWLSEFLAPALLKNLIPFLQKDKVDTMLSEVLDKANKALRREVPAARPARAGNRWESALEKLRKQVITPQLNRFIDEAVQTPSQIRREYIKWMRVRLASPGEHNITQQLRADPEGCALQEMIWFQKKLNANDSSELADLVRELIPQLQTLIANPSLDACKHFEANQPATLARLMKIEESLPAEAMQLGFQGDMQHKAVAGVKEVFSRAVKLGLAPVATKLRSLGNNKAFMKHVILCQMGLLLKA